MDQNTQTQATKRIPAISASIMQDTDGKANGVKFEAPTINREFEFPLSALSTDLFFYAACHGLKQKVGDAAAMSRNPDTGKAATVQDKWLAMSEVIERLMSGQWNAEREGGGGASYLLRAMIELKPGVDPEKIKTWLASKSPAERTAMEQNPQVKAIVDRMKAAKAADVDTDAMIDELDGIE